jgi:hypothetical protein
MRANKKVDNVLYEEVYNIPESSLSEAAPPSEDESPAKFMSRTESKKWIEAQGRWNFVLRMYYMV